jgi:hypothetical protein
MPSAMLRVIRARALSDMHLLPDMKSSEGAEWPLSLNTERFFFPSQSHGTVDSVANYEPRSTKKTSVSVGNNEHSVRVHVRRSGRLGGSESSQAGQNLKAPRRHTFQ